MSRPSRDTARIWFTREQGVVNGPFPSGMIRRFVVLGRLSKHSEVSPDGHAWQPLGSISRLLPEAGRSGRSEFGQEAAELMRRWEDERRGERRRLSDEAASERRRSERRRPESDAVVERRLSRGRDPARARNGKTATRRSAALWLAGLLAPLLAGGIYLAWNRPADAPIAHDCRAPPAPGVDWTHCTLRDVHLDGAVLSHARIDDADLAGASLRRAQLHSVDLSYSNLQRANLVGADLTQSRLVGADLRAADLTGALLSRSDLSFADLRGARIDGAHVGGARLDAAIWVDGETCAPGSTGACRR